MNQQNRCPYCEGVLAPLRKRTPEGPRHSYCLRCNRTWYFAGPHQIYFCNCRLAKEALPVEASP